MKAPPREDAAVWWSFALLFCVFASWYSVRPVRDAMGVAGSVRDLPRLFLVTLAVTAVVSPVLSAVVSRFSRRRFVAIAYRLAALSLVAFACALRGAAPGALAARAFFVWSSVLNLFEISLAWALMADVFTRDRGIRFFARIGGGGTLGAIAGSAIASVVGGNPPLALGISALFLEAAVRCAHRTGAASTGPDGPSPEGGVVAWLRSAVANRYFLAISGYLLAFTFSSTVIYLEQARIIRATLADTAARSLFLARVDLAANALAFVLQVTIVGRGMRLLGIGVALAVLPLVTLGCFGALRVAPILPVLAVCQVARRSLDFALTKPAREVLFTMVERAEKYKAKSFIDTFVYRGGDAFAAAGFEALPAGVIAAAMTAVCGAWAIVGLVLGRWNRRVPAPHRRAL